MEMTKDEIICMAREANLLTITEPSGYQVWIPENLEKFVNLIASAEREACAKVAEERLLDKANCTAEEMYELQKKSITAAIRARGQQ
jgi:hypothetical protein